MATANKAATHKVVAPLVISKKENGGDLYLYHGAVLPDHVGDEERQRLLDMKFIEPVSGAEADAAQPSSESN